MAVTLQNGCDGTTYCSCEPANLCNTPIPNTIACSNTLPPSSPVSQYQLACSTEDCTTCDPVECGVQCAPNTQYDTGSNSCLPFNCDDDSLPVSGSLPGDVDIELCSTTPTQVDDPYVFAGDRATCDTAPTGCMYFYGCSEFGQVYTGSSGAGACSNETAVEKTATLNGSTIAYTINVSLAQN